MSILPVKDIHDEDVALFGVDLRNLAKLAQLNFPVAEGVAVTPPEITLKTILKYFATPGPNGQIRKEEFEEHLQLIHDKMHEIAVPEEFEKELDKKKLDTKELWHQLLDLWMVQLRSQIWRLGIRPEKVLNLSAQGIFFIDAIQSSGTAFFDEHDQAVVVKTESGTLTTELADDLHQLVVDANRRLFIPQIYQWVVSNKLYLIKVTPYTQIHASSDTRPHLESLIERSYSSEQSIPKTSVKVYLSLGSDYRIKSDRDHDR